MELVFYAKIFRGGIFLPISTLPLERNPLPPVSLPPVKLFDVEMCWNLPLDCLCSAGFFWITGQFYQPWWGRRIILVTECVIDSGFSIHLRPAYPLPRLRAPCPLLRGWTQAACPFALSLPLLARGVQLERWSDWVRVRCWFGSQWQQVWWWKKKEHALRFHGWANRILSVIDYGWWELIELLRSAYYYQCMQGLTTSWAALGCVVRTSAIFRTFISVWGIDLLGREAWTR